MFALWLVDARLYWRLVVMQVRAQAQYRFNLALSICTIFVFSSLEFMAVLLYFGRFPTMMGWHVAEVVLLVAFVIMGYSLGHMFGAGVDHFDAVIRRGEFDRVMLRPAGTIAQIMGNEFRLHDLGKILEGVLLFGLSLRLLPGVHWTLAKVLLLPLGILSNAVVFVGIMIMGATICFWTVDTTELVNIPVDGGREMTSYPLTVYHPRLQQIFLFVIPLGFGSYLPTCYILDRPLPLGLPPWVVFLAPLAATAFVLAATAIWRFGVRHYRSTGS